MNKIILAMSNMKYSWLELDFALLGQNVLMSQSGSFESIVSSSIHFQILRNNVPGAFPPDFLLDSKI